MSAIHIRHVKAVSVLKVLSRGRTKPCLTLAQDEDGKDVEVVLKWRAAPELKATGLVCELVSALLAEDLDLPVPKPFLVEVPDGFHAGIATPEVSKLAQASVGLNKSMLQRFRMNGAPTMRRLTGLPNTCKMLGKTGTRSLPKSIGS
jgi:hypothetical protein